MTLFQVIIVTISSTLWGVLLVYGICSIIFNIIERSKRRKAREEWYIESIYKLINRLDDVEIQLDDIYDFLEGNYEDIDG